MWSKKCLLLSESRAKSIPAFPGLWITQIAANKEQRGPDHPPPPSCLRLPTFPSEEKALEPAAVHCFSVIEGKKQMGACDAVMVSIVESPLSIQGRAGCRAMGVL